LIVPLAREHAREVAALHVAALTGLVTELGPAAARAFYAGCAGAPAARGFVDLEGGVLRGFVLGSVDPGALRRDVLRRNPAGSLLGIAAGIARRPGAALHLMRSVRAPDGGSYDARSPELTYLAVAAAARGAGMGRALVTAFTASLREAGVRSYELSVDDGNAGAAAFYEKLGFVSTGTYREFGIEHRRYRLVL